MNSYKGSSALLWSRVVRRPSVRRPSVRHPSVVNFSHFRLLLWNHWTEFKETWQEARSQSPLPSFYTPVFRRDVLWYGDVRPSGSPSDSPSIRLSVHPTLRPSVRVSVRPFSTLFSYMLWHMELKFCTSLCFNVLQIKFECRHFASIFEGGMPLLELRI